MYDVYYGIALICLNGHIVNGAMIEHPVHNADYCKDCGAKTISICKVCDAEIKGALLNEDGFKVKELKEAPSYCHSCGKPYPWTETSIKALKELAEVVEQLSSEEKEQLSNSIDDIIADTPRTPLAVFILKKIKKKLPKETWSIMREIIVRVVTETVKQQLGL